MIDTSPKPLAYELGWHDEIDYACATDRGLDEQHIRDLSGRKDESADVLERRLTAFRAFQRMPMPAWGAAAELGRIDFDDLHYYMRATPSHARDWDEVPITIKDGLFSLW